MGSQFTRIQISNREDLIVSGTKDINGQWDIADVAFSITSKQKASEQMDTIHRLTERGKWFVGSDRHYIVKSDDINPIDG